MTWRSVLAAALIPIALAPAAMPARAAENVWSIEYFNSRKPEWEQLIGTTIRIEGRVQLSGGGQLRLTKCELPIHAGESPIPPLTGKKSVEITGRLVKENGKLVIESDRIQQVPSDVEQFESRTIRLRLPKPADWYALGDWAAERSRFYEDAELAKKAASAYERGITLERRALEPGDADGRFQLAEKIGQYNLPESQRMELVHEGDRILWDESSKAKTVDPAALGRLAAKLASDLPGSTQVLAAFPAELMARYEREPLAVYRESASDVRRQLHRIFYTIVQMKIVLQDAAADGRNGDEIAARLRQAVPEAGSLADQYLAMKLKWRLEQSATATRAEIEQLASAFRERKQPDLANQALMRWLRAREPRLREDGPLGLLQLADEYLGLLQDERKAVQFLVEANKADPDFADVTARLASLGYENAGGTWIKSRPAAAPVPAPVDPTIPGTVTIGMNAAAARNAMGGRPGSLARVVTKGGVAEVWSYGLPRTSRLVIRLAGTSLSPELKVVEIRNER